MVERIRVTLMWLAVGALMVSILGAQGGCQDCEMPSNVSTPR